MKGFDRRLGGATQSPKSFSLVIIAFLCGYLSATVMNAVHIHAWIKSRVFGYATKAAVPSETARLDLPQPKYEFYTLLTKNSPAEAPKHVVKAAPQESKPVAQTSSNKKDNYLLQVGSFKNKQEAERIKAALILRGYKVTVAVQANGGWYRVSVGPYGTRELAQKAQLAVKTSEHVAGIVRKMDV